MRRTLPYALAAVLLCACTAAGAQTWQQVVSDDAYLWGEGWGRSVEEADREALSSLASRISIAVRSEYTSSEVQRTSAFRKEYESTESSFLSMRSSSRLCNTSRVVLSGGRKAHVGRWIRRDEVEALFAARRERVLEYESMADEAERNLHLDDALRYHWWAYSVLRSLSRPSEMRDAEGRMLAVAIPERMNAILSGLSVSADRRMDMLSLSFRYRGLPVQGLDVTVFDGAGWSPVVPVRQGRASVRLAPGALGEIVQVKVQYAYCGDAGMDDDLGAVLNAADSAPLKKSLIIFRR